VELHTDLGRRLRGAYFPGISDQQLESSIEQLLSGVRTEHYAFHDSTLRQVLCICFLNPSVKSLPQQSQAGRATVRLQLANGLLFALHLRGNIRPALDRLEQIGHWLALRPYALDEFEHYELALSELVNAGQAAGERCEIRLARFASVMPLPGISREMLKRTAFSAFNGLRKRYGLRPLNRYPHLLSQHVVSHVDASAHTVDSYLTGLDQHALGLIRRFDSTYRHRYNDLRVYNFFVAEHGKFCRNRIQAVQELPWLLRILSGMHNLQSDDTLATMARCPNDLHAVKAIVEAIDSGKQLFRSVARAYDVPKETVRWTRHRMLPSFIHCGVSRVDLLLKMLSWLPAEKRPGSDEEWRAMDDLVCTLLSSFSACHDEAGIVGTVALEHLRNAGLAPDDARAINHPAKV